MVHKKLNYLHLQPHVLALPLSQSAVATKLLCNKQPLHAGACSWITPIKALNHHLGISPVLCPQCCEEAQVSHMEMSMSSTWTGTQAPDGWP